MYLQTGSMAVLVFLSALPGSSVLHAREEQVYRHHEAHVHGQATLTLAVEDHEVQVVLSSPAANIVGFEHPPVTAADRTAVARARTRLEEADTLFSLPEGADCRTVHTEIDSALFSGEPDRHTRDHEDHPDAVEHHASGSHRHETGNPKAVHTDITAEYHFECARPERLNQLDIHLFTIFPAIEHLELEYIIGDKQGAAELTRASPALAF